MESFLEKFKKKVKKRIRYITFCIDINEIDTKIVPILGSKTSPMVIYLKMRSKIIRDGWIDYNNYAIKDDYYDKGYLVMTMSIRQMAKEFNVNKRSILKAIHLLNKYNWIDIKKLKIKKSFKAQYVYIFGTWNRLDGGRVVENFFNDPFIELE